MTTFGVTMVRDEADVIAGTLRHLAGEVDHLIVADNGSVDGTREILAQLVDELPLTVFDDRDLAYYQSAKVSALADRAAAMGAVWVVPFDADELWLADRGRIRDVLAGLDAYDVAIAPLYNHFCTAIDPFGSDPFRTMVWRQPRAAPLVKVAFRWRPGAIVHQGNHGVTLPGGCQVLTALEVRHFPARSPQQFSRKGANGAQAYRATDLPETEGAHWRGYGHLIDRFGPHALEDVFRQHWWYYSPVDAGLVYDPAPYLHWRNDAAKA